MVTLKVHSPLFCYLEIQIFLISLGTSGPNVPHTFEVLIIWLHKKQLLEEQTIKPPDIQYTGNRDFC